MPTTKSTTPATTKAPAGTASKIEPERAQFRQLILSNKNYFGNFPETKLKPVKQITGNTFYEQLTCVGFNPDSNLLEGTIQIKQPFGYGGDLCQAGTQEYVRFFVNYGGGWEDAGLAAVNVHDIPTSDDCAKQSNKPLTYVVTLPLDPKRNQCGIPVLPKVHAILSWELIPPAGAANVNWPPVWGNTIDCNIQIKPRPKIFIDVIEAIGAEIAKPVKIPAQYASIADAPLPLPDPPPETLQSLAKMYAAKSTAGGAAFSVEAHRFGLKDVHHLLSSASLAPDAISAKAAEWSALGIDLSAAIAALNKTNADVSYEQLECLGLDYNLERLAGILRIKRPSGYSGDLCHNGSKEYVSFWADWDNTCQWTYLNTVSLNVHDIANIPPEGLCYAVYLPVDLTLHRNNCGQPKIGRVRAVLSWNVPPSTTNPDALNFYGNRLDTHVQIKPGPAVGTVTPIIWKLGGINVMDINLFSGLTTSTAQFENGLPPDDLGRPCPFGARVVIKGPPFPGLLYRVQVKKVSDPTWTTVTTKLHLEPLPGFGLPYDKTPVTPDGFFTYETIEHNPDMILGWWDTAGDDLWEVKLEIFGVPGVDIHLIQLDNTAPNAEIHIDSGGDCKDFVDPVTIKGHFIATDLYFGSYSLQTLPFAAPAGQLAPTSGTVQTGTFLGDDAWQLDTTNMQPCGYVVFLSVADRSIVNSSWGAHHWTPASVGFCLRAKAK